MGALSSGLIALVALLHLWFLVLESFLWRTPLGLKAFAMTKPQAEATWILAANQGLYNGFLVAGLVWALLSRDASKAFELKVFFLGCVVAAGAVGGLTVSPKVFLIQGLPALLALGALFLA